jgi:hypothetical protein
MDMSEKKELSSIEKVEMRQHALLRFLDGEEDLTLDFMLRAQAHPGR